MVEVIVCIIAGLLAGFGTGFAGLSAAVFIAPMLITFLNMNSFTAIGIALASDVLASAVSALTYYKNKNTSLKKILPLMLAVFSFAIVGTIISHLFTNLSAGESIMGWWLIVAMLLLGIKLLFRPADNKKENNGMLKLSATLIMIIGGCYIGFVCGFQGTGGGLMMLFVLNILLSMDYKKAVGNSVCIMSVTALIGAVSHFSIQGLPDIVPLTICVVFTLLGATIAAYIANKINPIILKRLTGGLMTSASIIMLVTKI